MAEWTIKKLNEIADFNPKETIAKGSVAKKIPMDKLQPYCRDVPCYVMEKFSGGTKFRNGDTIMARITPCLENGKTALVNLLDDNEVGFGSTEYIVFRAKGNVDKDYLYYLVCSPQVKEPSIKSMVGSSGRQRVQTDVVQNIEINVPDYETQKRIGGYLKMLDDKIKTNNEINNNLFDQAVTLFNNKLETTEDISSTLLGNIADVKGGKRLPKGKNLTTEPTSHPYIRVRDLNDAIFASLDSNYEYVDEETQKTISRYIVSSGDVLISIVGTIGLTAIVDNTLETANLTENCVKLTNLKYVSPEYLLLYLRSNAGQEAIAKSTVGAVQLKLPLKNIQALPVPLLNSKELTSLNEILAPIFAKISNNVIENRKLIGLREAILPKLLSGELDVSAIEI